MSYTGAEAAEQVVRMSLESTQVAAKISGQAAVRIAKLLTIILKGQQKTKGRTRLSNMLKSGKELKVYTIPDEKLESFCKEAKRYGVLYCVLKDPHYTEKTTDLFIRAEDAPRISRIMEKLHSMQTEVADVSRTEEKIPDKSMQIPQSAVTKNAEERQIMENLPTKGSEKNRNLSEPSFVQTSEGFRHITKVRPSVKLELREISVEQAKKKSKVPVKIPDKRKER